MLPSFTLNRNEWGSRLEKSLPIGGDSHSAVVKPPNMIPNVEESILVNDFSLKTTSAPKPEAPWIKRCDYGIKFTDEIQVIEGQPSEEVTETEMTTNKDNEEDDDD